jgi:predicted peptidase
MAGTGLRANWVNAYNQLVMHPNIQKDRSRLRHRIALLVLCALTCLSTGAASKFPLVQQSGSQRVETGFLNREIRLNGVTYRYQVYVPYGWNPKSKEKSPIILALHGSGERGNEGMWQTQAGIAVAVRDHPERWPFVIVMPQCPYPNHWPDHEMMTLALSTLDQATSEFNGDPERTYVTGLSLGGYGAWELLRDHPHRFAAAAIIASGVFWGYAPERWQRQAALVQEYSARAVHTPIWLFHGTADTTVIPKESELMYEGVKSIGGTVRLWEYTGLNHNSWDRAYNEPELPRWLLSHSLKIPVKPYSEKLVIPLHPPVVSISVAAQEALVGEYMYEKTVRMTIFRQGDKLYRRNANGEISELLAENPSTFFLPIGGSTRYTFEREGTNGPVRAVVLKDDRHEERWTKK